MLSDYWKNKNLKFLNCNVKQFQTLVNITVDGKYGPITDLVLINYIKIIQEKIGSEQDGLAGNNTIKKLISFQKQNGLVPDGICGVNTRAKLFSQSQTWNFPNFEKSEFSCKCGCGLNNINYNLVSLLQYNIRPHFGNLPTIITSGSRCQKHNAAVGGIKGSEHLKRKCC